ncbi:MAG: ornithine cyclodeaminase family protein [Candidatus Aminicenantes bacterium]|nr:ornithine cyclodeaminase family protein [Candidatus Aminicenantes bacterium]
MPAVFYLAEIEKALGSFDPLPLIEEGFVAYSRGQVVVPPVGEMIFEDPPGDVHIKYGYIKSDDWYVIKIASGFYDNPKAGLPSGDGLMLLFSQKTGLLDSVFLERGHLTNVRTAAAGAVAAKYLAPGKIRRVGVLGAGVQGRMQLDYLRKVREFEEAVVWGTGEEELEAYRRDMEGRGFTVRTTLDAEEVAASSAVIVTCTPSTRPLLRADWIRPGTHITAVGSDTSEKQELDPAILAKADRVVVDSLSQSELRGEVFKAVRAGAIGRERLVELGRVIAEERLRRASDEEITVADLTGVAVQDIQICKAVRLHLP